MSRRKLLVWVALLGFLLAEGKGMAQDVPLGGIRLLSGYEHKRDRGIDSWVGTISKPGGLTISYDIGPMAGNYANNYEIKDRKWIKRQVIDGRAVLTLLTNDDTLYVIFDASSANFRAKVKSYDDIAEMLLMVLTYRNAETAPATRPSSETRAKRLFEIEHIQGTFYYLPAKRWHIYIRTTGEVRVSILDEKWVGTQYEGPLTDAEMGELVRVFNDWHELDRRYPGTKTGDVHPILNHGGLEVSPEQGSNPPRQFIDAAQLLVKIGTRISGQVLNK